MHRTHYALIERNLRANAFHLQAPTCSVFILGKDLCLSVVWGQVLDISVRRPHVVPGPGEPCE